jgi:hypothetical protein
MPDDGAAGPLQPGSTLEPQLEVEVVMDSNLEPLFEPVQAWWTAEHEKCVPVPVENYDPEWLVPFPRFTPTVGPYCAFGCGWRRDRSLDQLVLSLRPRLKASAVEAAQMLERPDAQIALQVASALVPRPFGDELTLVTDLIEAAGAQTVQDRNRALAGVGISLVVLALIYLFSKGS